MTATLRALDVGVHDITNEHDQPERVAWVLVDATSTPEVADLARVHRSEGVQGQAWVGFRAHARGDALTLSVRQQSPVRCSFAVEFALPGALPVLQAAADLGTLVVLTGGESHLALQLRVDGATLADTLARAATGQS